MSEQVNPQERYNNSPLVQIHNPDFGGEPATVTREAYDTLYADKGFKVVDSADPVKETKTDKDGNAVRTYNYESKAATKAASTGGAS